ncbi:MAG: thioredoxin [Parachlamydiaceae bacterium]|nr:MAG: thioredoxin [Parachlamydiaceae bacterium]
MAENVKHLDDENFQSTIDKGVTLVDFFADWCGPCKMIAPIIEDLGREMNGKATVAKLDIENAQGVTGKYGVTSIPTIIVFKDGNEVKRFVGVRSKEDLKNAINSAL